MATQDHEQVLERLREATRVDTDQTEQCGCVENVYNIVPLQYIEMRSALSGRGNYTLVPAFSRRLVLISEVTC